MATFETLQKCVEAGATRLDTAAPGWESRIRPAKLDLHSGHNCVLGQVFGSFSTGTALLFGSEMSLFDLTLVTSNCGFLVSHTMIDLELGDLGQARAYDALTDLWIARIQRAREGASHDN